MRVGRPIPAPTHPACGYCGAKASLARAGDRTYPYGEDFGPVWICEPCQAWIGVRGRSKNHTPLGRLANAALRDAKNRLHRSMEPLVSAKMRRDGVSVFEARGKAVKWLATSLGFELNSGSIHELSLEQCERAIRHIAAFQASRDACRTWG